MPKDILLFPTFPRLPNRLFYSGCGVVGSTIYVLGGLNIIENHIHFHTDPNHDVYYIETDSPLCCWKKSSSMKKPRLKPRTVTVDGKMFALGGRYFEHFDDLDVHSWAEVFEDHKGWCELLPARIKPGLVTGHVLLDNKRIMFHMLGDDVLYTCDIESDSVGTYFESSVDLFEIPMTSASVDGVLYWLDYAHPGFLFGLDVSKPGNFPQKVQGLDNCCIPQPIDDFFVPTAFLISLENSKLGVLWADTYCMTSGELEIHFSKLKMSKQENASTGQVDFVADPLSVSHYHVMGTLFFDCLPMFLSQKGVTKDVSKDGNPTSTNSSSNKNRGTNNNDGEEEKKGRKKKKKQIP